MIHIRWKAVNAYQVNQQTSLNPIASPEPGSRMGLKRNRVERRYRFMKCKRLSAAILSLVMIISLLPTTALAAEENDVWSTAYDEIRVYMDDATKADHDNLEGILPKQVRLYTSKALLDEYVFCPSKGSYWKYSNRLNSSKHKVTAIDITSIDLACDKTIGHSPTISIPIEGNTKYKVTVSEGKGGKYLRIDITKRTPHTVTYEFSGDHPGKQYLPASEQATATTKVTLPTVTTPITGTLNGKDGTWTFNGWTVTGDQTDTQIPQEDKKFIMPDENVTVTGTWTFTSDPTPVYVYFKTVNTKNELVKVESGVTYNANGSSWATLGKLVTATPVTPEKKNILGAEVKTSSNFVKHDSNKDFDLDWISEWVDLKRDNGAAGYESEAPFGTHVWHLDGQVNVYKLSYDANRPAGVTADVTVPDSAYYLPGWNAPVSTDDPTLQGYNFGGWYKEPECVNEAKEKVAVAEDTVLYAKWTPLAQPTADLIDDDITIKHGVNGAPADGDDSTAHIVKKDAKISYQATLDMKNLDFGANPEHADAVRIIRAAMTSVGVTSLWDFIKNNSIDIFADSKVNLYVKFSDKLENPATLNGITLKSGWFKLDRKTTPTYNNTTGYWTIPCVIKDATDAPDIDTNDSIVTLSGITLPLTADAQDELRSDTALDITSGGYIDGTIKIYTYELSLIGKSKEAPAENTAKLKLDVPTYTVTYDGNGADSGKTTDPTAYATGAKATVKANGYTRNGYTFTGWNTEADGRGDSYKTGDWITMTGSVILYAQRTRNSSHGGDDDDKYFFAIQKVDAQDGHALNGAKFELYQLDKNDRIVNRRVVETRQQSSKNGIALFGVDNKNSYDGIWYYAEVSAPEGYVLDNTEHKIKATDFFDSLSTAVKYADTVRNYRGTTPDLLNDSDHFAYVIGYMDGNVRPYGLISRAETTTIFFRLLKDSVRDGNLLTSNTYTDVPDDYWANTAISTMTGLDIVRGYDAAAFGPGDPITRAQFAAICARFDTGKSNGSRTFSDIEGHWAKAYIERAAELGWISGFQDGTFRPDAYITRAQAVTMINRMLNRVPEDPSDLLPGMNVWPDCNPGDWFYLAVQEATNSHDFEHKAGNYETWTKLMKNPDWTRYEN